MDTDDQRLPTAAYVACLATFPVVLLAMVGAFQSGAVIVLAFVPAFLIGAVGIVRRRVWSAYGLAIIDLAQLVPVIPSLRGETIRLGHVIAILLTLAFAALYILAGRSLAAIGAERGRAAPWIAYAAIVTIPFLFLRPFLIPTGSMEETLLIGDRILVKRWKVDAKRGDIIAHRNPTDLRQAFVKRVIGIPGDRIQIIQKKLIRNGTEQPEPYVIYKTSYLDKYRDNFPNTPNVKLFPGGADMLKNML
jgi:signal peptidase I